MQWREPDLGQAHAERLFDAVLARTRAANAALLVNSRHPRAQWERADGVHLTAEALRTSRVRPPLPWVGASVHDAGELERACALGLDFVVLGSVLSTTSHPDRAPMGWDTFERLAAGTAVPAYAIGGMTPLVLRRAMACGAHGIAMLTAAWQPGQRFGGVPSVGGVSSASSAGPPGTT
jgi:8-oxo-dGTP diphosphatase